MSLILRTVEVDRARPGQRWRWILADEQGRELADHLVDLDAASVEFEAFCDLAGFVRRGRDPHDPVGSEANIVARIGRWLGDVVFGPAIGRELTCRTPCTVEVRPALDAMFILDRPLEMAHLEGQPLGRLGISLVLAVEENPGDRVEKKQIGERVRILALFSLPSRTSVLAQRRERFELARLVHETASRGRAVELRVLQYGVTRQVLADAVDDGTGWDILHLSSHGAPGSLVLELADGSPDPVATAELVRLLHPTRRRLKLALVSACDSGAATAEETLRWLQLDEQADSLNTSGDDVSQDVPAVGVARGLVAGLDTAVVAMRYPVSDDFAIVFAHYLYPRLLQFGEPLDAAFREAVLASCGNGSSTGHRPLSVATPTLFGTRAAGLRVAPPPAPGSVNPHIGNDKAGSLPPEATRFVGRVQLLIAAGHALAPSSRHGGVLFTGMAGAGKTACAIELAHQYVDRFDALAWWRAPGSGTDGVLETLADTWEHRLGIPMMGAVGNEEEFAAFIDQLRALLRDNVFLLVLDNLDTLLTDTGVWLDPQVGSLLTAACTHGGKSRVILTSRRTPTSVPGSILTCHTHALSLAESVLLARELPHLSRLLNPEAQRQRPAAKVAADRHLVRRTLSLVQGHPKLLELADAAAENPDDLRKHLDNAEDTVGEREVSLRTFFSTGTSELDDVSFLSVLYTWTRNALADLPHETRALAYLLACMEDADRQSGLVKLMWHVYWDKVDSEQVLPLKEALRLLVCANLAEKQPVVPDDEYQFIDIKDITDVTNLYDTQSVDRAPVFSYQVHPAVVEVIYAETDERHRMLINGTLGDFWLAVATRAAAIEGQGVSMAARTFERACLSASRYLVRSGRMRDAGRALVAMANRSSPPATTHHILRQLRQIAAAETDPEERLVTTSVYGFKLAEIDIGGGVETLRSVLAEARRHGFIQLAATTAGNLLDVLLRNDSPEAAVEVSQDLIGLQRQAQVARWTIALSQAQRLRIMVRLGRHSEALAGASQLLADLATMPTPSEETVDVSPWLARDLVLEVAEDAAFALGRWQLALDFNEQFQKSMYQRGVDDFQQARGIFNASGPLLRLGRLDDAERVLLRCQAVFENCGDIKFIGLVFARRGMLETARGRHGHAIEFQQRAMRYLYQRPDEPRFIASGHAGLAECLNAAGDDQAIHHDMAAALLYRAAGDHSEFTALMAPNSGEYDLTFILEKIIAHNVEQIPGVRFGRLLTSMVPEPGERTRLLALIMAPTVCDILRELLRRGQLSVIERLLSNLACTREWKPLASALRRIINGENDPLILADLDDVSTAIVHDIFAR